VVGEELARRYRSGGGRVLAAGVSLVRDADIVSLEETLARHWGNELLWVGRVEPEKNPLLLADVVNRLGPGWRLTAVGTGSLRDELSRRLGGRAELPGYIPWGPELRAQDRAPDVLVTVSDTAGVPQAVLE